jgi:hypothetical protein
MGYPYSPLQKNFSAVLYESQELPQGKWGVQPLPPVASPLATAQEKMRQKAKTKRKNTTVKQSVVTKVQISLILPFFTTLE